MLEARKENKVYKIDETLKARYLNEGFDIYENGKLIENTPKKLIKLTDHNKAIAEKDAKIAKLEAKLKKLESAETETKNSKKA